MQDRHTNKEQYFNEQGQTTAKYVIPYLKSIIGVNESTSILEIGCGEGGNLKPFLDVGCSRIVGVDLSKNKIDHAIQFFSDHPNKNKIKFIEGNIYDMENIGQFNIILTRDVLEHIHDQERFMYFVKKFMKPESKFFLGFPPWHNPFGGHQQICASKLLSKLPFFHILPKPIYKLLLKAFKENNNTIEALMEIKDTRITIDRFERILKNTGYKKDKRTFYFINPNYEVKFGLKPRKQIKLFTSLPFVRNFIITAAYYIISEKQLEN